MIVRGGDVGVATPSLVLLPSNRSNEIRTAKYFVTQNLEVVSLVIVNSYPDGAVVRQEAAQLFYAITDQRQPERMLDAIIVVLESTAGVVRRVDKDTLHLPRVFLLECFKRK